MKKCIYKECKHFWAFVLLLSLIIAVSGCGVGSDEKITYTDVSMEDTYGGSAVEVFFPNTSENVNLTYTLDLDVSTKDVFFIFTNTSTGYRTLQVTESSGNIVAGRSTAETEEDLSPLSVSDTIDFNGPVIQRGRPEISDFNKTALANAASPRRTIYIPDTDPVPSYDVVGSATTFYLDLSNSDSSVDAHCRYVTPAPGININGTYHALNIWVADDCWYSGGSKYRKVYPDMVTALADVFLKDGTDDIYTWVAGIFGDEWVDPNINNLIGDNNEITILLYDIDNDNATPLMQGGVAGYFYAKDNFVNEYYTGSNERIMFYLDGVMFANYDGLTYLDWDITNTSPADIVSTLTHEFQHMIHFYQKQVRNGITTGTETWLDEMCSLVAEDFISMKLAGQGIVIKGPRGVDGDTMGPGLAGNTNGRLPYYNAQNLISLTDWPDDGAGTVNFLYSYAMSYAFGAYLARNYGGAELFQKIVQNSYTDYRAVEDAVTQSGSSDDFVTILRRWGAAVLLSDKTAEMQYYQYNNGIGGFASGSLGYDMGSINLINYTPDPFFFSSSLSGSMNPVSNALYLAGDNLTGINTWTMKLRESVRLTVLVR